MAKIVVASFPKFLALEFRLCLAILVFAPFLLSGGMPLPRLDAANVRMLVIQALLGIVVFNVLFFHALERTSAATAGIAYGTLPIMIALLARLLLGETLRTRSAVAVILASLGMIQLGINPAGPQSGTGIGTVFVFLAVACAALFTIIGKWLTAVLPPMWLSALVSFSAATMILPLAVEEAVQFRFGRISLGEWEALILWAIASGIGYIVLWHAGLSRVEAHSAGAFTGAATLVTVIGSGLITEEELGWQQLGGLIFVIAAVISVSWNPRSHPPTSRRGVPSDCFRVESLDRLSLAVQSLPKASPPI